MTLAGRLWTTQLVVLQALRKNLVGLQQPLMIPFLRYPAAMTCLGVQARTQDVNIRVVGKKRR